MIYGVFFVAKIGVDVTNFKILSRAFIAYLKKYTFGSNLVNIGSMVWEPEVGANTQTSCKKHFLALVDIPTKYRHYVAYILYNKNSYFVKKKTLLRLRGPPNWTFPPKSQY